LPLRVKRSGGLACSYQRTQHRAPGEAAAHRLQKHEVALLDAPVARSGGQRQRDGGSRRIAVLVDGDDDLLRADMPSFLAEPSMMRLLAWCGTSQSMSSAENPVASKAPSITSVIMPTACLKTSRPSMRRWPTVPVVDGPPST
jgi:hypothetical protein